MMERLTRRDEYLNAYTYGVVYYRGDSYDGEVIDKLAYYEDLEEQGLLLKLPCGVGTKVFFVNDDIEDMYLPSTKYYFIDEDEFDVSMINDLGKTVFLTKEEAEAKLKELQNE